MLRAWSITKQLNQRGFSAVEILLAASMFGMLVIAIVGALIYGQQSNEQAGIRGRATLLAEEGLEAMRGIRDANYANLTNGTFGLAQSSNVWTLSGSSDTNGVYTRTITIADAGSNRKSITSTVRWPRQNGTSSVTVTSQLTNWQAVYVKSWAFPQQASTLDITGTLDGLRVATQGNYAYMVRTDGTPDFAILNITNPAAPTLAGSLSVGGTATDIAVSGNYAYIGNSNNNSELIIVNISNPASPTQTSTFNANGTSDVKAVTVVGTSVYLARMANGLNDEMVVVNVATPSLPSRSGGYSLNVTMYDIHVSGTNVFLATSSDTQEVIHLVPGFLGAWTVTSYNLSGITDATSLSANASNILYVSQGANLYSMFDGAYPGKTTGFNILDTLTMSGTVNQTTVHSNNTTIFAATTDATKEFQVVQATDPLNLSILSNVDIPGTVTLNGLAYNSTHDVVVGATTTDTGEMVIFRPN